MGDQGLMDEMNPEEVIAVEIFTLHCAGTLRWRPANSPAIKQNPLEMISLYLILGTHNITNNEMKSSSSRKPSVIYVRFLFEVVLLPNNSRLFMAG